MFAFLEPLSLEVWIYTATLYLAVSIMLYIIARQGFYKKAQVPTYFTHVFTFH